MSSEVVWLDFEIHLTDKDAVATYQADLSEFPHSEIGDHPGLIAAPDAASVLFGQMFNGGPPLPLVKPGDPLPRVVGTGEGFARGGYLYSRWFGSAEFPTDVSKIVRKSGGWFGVPSLFGDTKEFVWRGVFLYDPPLTDTGGDGTEIRTPVMKRRFIDPGPANGHPNVTSFGTNLLSRDAAMTVDGFGFASRGNGQMIRHQILTEYTGAVSNQTIRCSWERIYLRVRRYAPTGTPFWIAEGSGPVSGCNCSCSLTASGQLAFYNIDNFTSSSVLIASTRQVAIDEWVKLDICIRFGDRPPPGPPTPPPPTFGIDDYGYGTPYPGAKLEVFLNGRLELAFTPGDYGFGRTSWHQRSVLGYQAADLTAEMDFAFWMNAQHPITYDGIDFMNGSRAVWVKADAFAAGHGAAWTGDLRLLLHAPRVDQYMFPTTVEGLVSTAALAELQVVTDADRALMVPGSIGVAGLVVCHTGHWGGTSEGQLGYKIGDAARVLVPFTNSGKGLSDERGTQNLPRCQRLMYAPGSQQFPLDPTTLLPLELHRIKGDDDGASRTYQLSAVAELIGVFQDADYPVDVDDALRNPLPWRGVHNAPYPQTPWAVSAAPPYSPVVIQSGTYVGNGTGQDLTFPVPVHWLWIRKATGAGNPLGIRWWSSMLGAVIGGHKEPDAWTLPVCEVDPTFVPAGEVDTQNLRVRVRLAGSHMEVNRNGDTYVYTAVMDPGMRFLLNGAMVHSAYSGDPAVPVVHSLVQAGFLPLGVLVAEQRSGNFTGQEMWFKGPGHTPTSANKILNGTLVADALAFGAGTLEMRAGFAPGTDYKHACYAAMRSDDGSGDPGRYGVFAFGSYTGNGLTARDIVHTVPGVSGKRPLWVLVQPSGSSGYVKDCQMPATTAFDTSNGSTVTTAITGAAVNQFSVGALCNVNATLYHYMIIWGGDVAGNGGMSACGQFWPVDPDLPPCVRIQDESGAWITPPGGCTPGPTEDPDPDGGGGGDGGDGDEPTGGGGGPDDIDTDLSVECEPFTKRLFNDALSRIGISKRIQWLSVPAASPWSATTAYVVRDAVTQGGTTYYCIRAHTNHAPPNATYWSTSVPPVDNTEEADLCRQHYARAVESTLRDVPWPFATRYSVLTLLGGSTASPMNRDWVYSYRQPSDCVFERRLAVTREGAVDPTPPPFQLSHDATGGRIFTNQADAQLEYTARPACTAGVGDPVFVDALTWRLASLIAGPLTRIADVTKLCLEQYELKIARAREVLRPGNPGHRTAVDPNLFDVGPGAAMANLQLVNRALLRIGAQTIANLGLEQSREANAARVIFEDELRSVLREYPWAFATRYLVPVRVGGTASVPVNADWHYSYRLPADCVKVRRVAAKDGATEPLRTGWRRSHSERDPEMFRIATDDVGALLYCHRVDPTIEYTARIPNCVLRSDALFRDALGWRLAASLAPSIALVDPDATEQLGRGPQEKPKERTATELQLRDRAATAAWRQYYLTIEKARVADANEQQQDSRDPDADWIRGRE